MNLESGVLQVHIEDIIPNRFQPRLNFDEQGLKELSDSIKEHGIIQPLVLRKLGDKYEIIAGERRYKAAQMAGLATVPAVISNIDDNTSAEVALVENIQRRDLTSIEEARSYKNLLDKGYMTQEQLAKRMGLSQPAIANKLRLLNLDDEVQQALLEEKISERHARTLLTLKDKKEQREWLHRIINERLTVRQLDLELKKINNNQKEEVEPLMENNNEPKKEQTFFDTTLNDFETLDMIEPLESTDNYQEASTVPDFNISTPNSIDSINDDLTIEEKANKYFAFDDTELNDNKPEETKEDNNPYIETLNTNDDNFIDLQTTPNIPITNINDEVDVPDETTEEVYNSPITISSNNKFFTPINENNNIEINNKPEEILDPMDVAAEIKNQIDNYDSENHELKDAINSIRDVIDDLNDQGFIITTDEIDKVDTYQITIEINKDN